VNAPLIKRPFDVEALRAEFPILGREVHGRPLVYLDNAASAQKPEAVIAALTHALTNKWLHAPTTFFRQAPPEARQALSRWAPQLFGWEKTQR